MYNHDGKVSIHMRRAIAEGIQELCCQYKPFFSPCKSQSLLCSIEQEWINRRLELQ